MIKDRGLELTMVGNSDVERDIKDYKPYDDDEEREARHGTKTGLDEDMDRNLSIPDSEAKKFLYEYYKSLFDNKVVIPFRLHPVVDSKNGVKVHDTYYFSVPSEDHYFNIRDTNHKSVSGKGWSDLMKRMRWMDTFLTLLSGLEDIHRTASDIEGPARIRRRLKTSMIISRSFARSFSTMLMMLNNKARMYTRRVNWTCYMLTPNALTKLMERLKSVMKRPRSSLKVITQNRHDQL
jgi:hypothetical protein